MSSAVEEGHLERRMEETASSPSVPNIYRNSSSGLHAAPPEVSREERRPLMKGKGWAGGKTATPPALSSTPHQAFSAKSSDSSPPLPVFKQSVSSAMTGSGSGSVSTNNHENGTAAADAAGGGGGVRGREGAAAGGLGHAAFKGEGTEESREEEDERGRRTKDGRGLLLGRRGRGDKEKQEKNSKERQRRGIFSESNSTKDTRIVPARTRKEGAILKENRDVNAAAGAVDGEGVHITGEETHGGNVKENEEGSRNKRDLHTSADGREGKGRWASIFRDSLEGLMKRGEKTRESAALLNSGEVEYRALNSVRAGEERTTARGAARGFEGSHRGRGSSVNNTGEGNTTTATVPALSSDVERGRCVMDLEEKEQKARHWIIGSMLVYLALGILVLYCVSYANIEWCCIFVVFGGAVAAVGLCGLRQASRVTLLVHAAAAAALLFTLFVAWCYNVYVLLRAVEILMASSWPPSHQHQFQNYYSIPTTYTSPPARWIEEVLRMRLSYPSEENAAIEMLIRRPPRPTGDGSYFSRKRRPKKRQALPWHRKQESDDLLLHNSADSANEKTAAPLTGEGIGGRQAEEDILEGDTLPETAAEGAGGRGKRGQAAGAAAAVAAAAGGGRATQSRQDTQQSGNQTPRKLDAAPSVTTASIEGKKTKEARRLRNDGLRHHDASANAHARRRLAAEENHTQGRRDGKGETQEGRGETTGITRNKKMVSSGGGDSTEQQSHQVQLVTEDAGGKQQHIPLSSAEEEVVAGGPAAEARDTTEADEMFDKTHPAAAEKKEERNMERSGATLDWQEIWRQERSSGGLRRRLGDTTPGGGTAATTATAAQGAPGALGTSPAAGTVRETRRHPKKKEETGRRRHQPFPLRVSSAANPDSPPEDAASPTPRAPEPAAAAGAASRPSPARLATESATAGASATSAAANVRPDAGDRRPTSPSSAAERTAAQADTGEDKPLAGQLRGSGAGVEEKGEETVLSGSDDDDKGNAAAAAMWLSLTAAEAEENRAAAAAVAAANDEDRGWQLYRRRQRSTMERSAAERRLIRGCVEKADKNPLYVTEAAHAMSSLATRGWLCAFARADVLPFHRWPVDCNTECGYEFLHAGHDLQTSNYYDMTRIAEYLIQISSLSAKRMQQCVDYAASTICSIKNRNFIVVWVVLLLLWLLFACVACCGILPFSLYNTVLVIKGMQQQQQQQSQA